jgi:sugar-specific transcriptional regulator TrmB
LTKELEIFGFTLNQAKIYLTILKAGSTTVGKIAEISKLHRQDIYKITPILERKGVITKSLGMPIIIQAIPVKNALKNLVAMEKKKALERITRMESSLDEISTAMSMLYETATNPADKGPLFNLLTKENAIINSCDLLFEKATQECDVVASVELITLRAAKFRERFQNAINNGAIIRLIIENPTNDERTEAVVKRVRPESDKFIAKFLASKSPKPFQIIDHRDIWISRREKFPSGVHYVLWTNSINIGEVYKERFRRLWDAATEM